MITAILQESYERLSLEPEERQRAIAALVMEELDSERRWDAAFARTQDALARMADEALAEDEREIS
jgi:hypothetical protein